MVLTGQREDLRRQAAERLPDNSLADDCCWIAGRVDCLVTQRLRPPPRWRIAAKTTMIDMRRIYVGGASVYVALDSGRLRANAPGSQWT